MDNPSHGVPPFQDQVGQDSRRRIPYKNQNNRLAVPDTHCPFDRMDLGSRDRVDCHPFVEWLVDIVRSLWLN